MFFAGGVITNDPTGPDMFGMGLAMDGSDAGDSMNNDRVGRVGGWTGGSGKCH